MLCNGKEVLKYIIAEFLWLFQGLTLAEKVIGWEGLSFLSLSAFVFLSVFLTSGDWDCYPMDPAVWHVSVHIIAPLVSLSLI